MAMKGQNGREHIRGHTLEIYIKKSYREGKGDATLLCFKQKTHTMKLP